MTDTTIGDFTIWGYYDESGEYDAAGKLLNMTIGGCFAPFGNWKTLNIEWKKALEEVGLTFFHMTDFEAWANAFDFKLSDGSRDKEKHKRILDSLLNIMLRHIQGFHAFGAVSMFDPDSPPQTHKNLMEDCIGGAIKHAVLDVAHFYGQPINLVFGKQKHFPESEIRKYVDFYDYGGAKGRIKSFSTDVPKNAQALQTADIIAYEIARAQRKGRPERYPYQKLVDGAKGNGSRMSVHWGPIRSRKLVLS